MKKKKAVAPAGQTVWLSSEEVAERLGVTHWTVLRWAKSGDPRLPAYKVWDEPARDQGRFRFRKEDVDAFGGDTPAIGEESVSTTATSPE